MADSIIRCEEHLKNFTLIDNTCMKTATLSMQAMGLFAYLMTLPKDWVVYKSELVNHFSNGRDAVYKAFNELIDNGFITFTEKKNEKGQFNGYEYFIHEKPVEDGEKSARKPKNQEETENGKPDTGKPYTENPSLLSTNKQSTNNKNSKSHCEKAEKQAKQTVSFRNEDYEKVFTAYFDNCETLYNQGKLKIKKPAFDHKFIKARIKTAFQNYGVDTVVSAVKESINHRWLVEEKSYTFAYIFGPNMMPSLINKTYDKINSQHINKTMNNSNFDKRKLAEKIDFDDITIYE